MKSLFTGAALLIALATPALADPPTPATSASPAATATSSSMSDIRPAGMTPASKHSKKRASSTQNNPTSLYPLSIQQQQDVQRQELDELFHIDHSG
jgi:hypothetical protein